MAFKPGLEGISISACTKELRRLSKGNNQQAFLSENNRCVCGGGGLASGTWDNWANSKMGGWINLTYKCLCACVCLCTCVYVHVCKVGESLVSDGREKCPFSCQQLKEQSYHGNRARLGTERSGCFSERSVGNDAVLGDTTILSLVTHEMNMAK